MPDTPLATLITPTAPIEAARHGGRAKCLQRLVRLDLPVPCTVALSFEAVQNIAAGALPDIRAILSKFSDDALLCVRPSSEVPDWGGPGAILNIGMNDIRYLSLKEALGHEAAASLYLRFVQSYAVHVARLDPDVFDDVEDGGPDALREILQAYEAETDEVFPQDPAEQLGAALRSMARAWEGTSARLLRQAKGGPADAGLGLGVQEMIPGLGQGECGSGVLQLVSSTTGKPQLTGRYLSQSQGREALGAGTEALFLERDLRGPSLEELSPMAFARIKADAALMRKRLREEMQVEFVIQNGNLHILDGVRVQRSSQAAVRIAVALAEDGIIPPHEAVMRVDAHVLNELLHRQVSPTATRDVIGSGIAASPGAATGQLVFTAADAQSSAARGEPCILVRRETSPEDVRGMHAAVAVLTGRGGMTSHAAVIGRGLGSLSIVGASDMKFDAKNKLLSSASGGVFRAGDIVTIDGSSGKVLAGEPEMLEAAQDDAFQALLTWADEARDIGIRANADTPADAQTARNFNAEGIGLCRTEHMFFDPGRLTVMREMIFAESLKRARGGSGPPVADAAQGFPGTVPHYGRPAGLHPAFDPPLHEVLPTSRTGQRELSEALDIPVSDVTRRVEEMHEYNPMLGLRGVRLGVTVPEIYDMEARAIFEATLLASKDGAPVVPEVMIPLVSAKREVELVKARIDAVAAAVASERGESFDYRLGVMVETPRAALRAAEISPQTSFLSFGTNDLTQMTYGLSRDDAGRFMSNYVQQGVFPEDPFHVLDVDGVGELLKLGVQRGRSANPQVTLSICGEHGGNPESIAFCREAGFDYVSCSPFRVPVVRLAAAQLAIEEKTGVPSPTYTKN
ncbi:putative PEP-binding protein [Pseudophaeobacter leonis]|uniref:putative PEP-binding protein n=1 Tax=Pseudophaeobacter leonis TaxID=1144477 RepID=UPI001F4D7E00|nr:putative PEP-binding protein [Pseudophaeobacter leonis]